MKIVKIGIAILIISVMLSTASADNKYYLNPTDSSVSVKDDTIDVELWLEAGEPVCGGAVSINYTYCCAEIIDFTSNTDKFEDMGYNLLDGQMNMLFFHWGASAVENQPADSYKLGTLTILCCSDESNCKTDLKLVECLLYESVNSIPTELGFTTEDGTFTCGTPEPEPETCLGDCYNQLGQLIYTNVNCSVCLAESGNKWINNPCPDSDSGCTCLSQEWTECPQCCDGIDNDNDGLVDWPNDPKCGCCIDENETNGDVSCPPPCIPELPTFTLMSLGVLGMLLLVRKRG